MSEDKISKGKMVEFREFRNVKAKRSKLSDLSFFCEEGIDDLFSSSSIKFYAVIYYVDQVEVLMIENREELKNLQKRLEEKFSFLLELRLFSETKEYYLLKAEGGFVGRVIEDSSSEVISDVEKQEDGFEEYEIFDELHKIWNRCRPENFRANSDTTYVRVRNYFSAKGKLRFLDWRFVDFEEHIAKLCED